jgi:hypothetical protein
MIRIRLLSPSRERQELELPGNRLVIESNYLQLAPGRVAQYEQLRWRFDNESYMLIQILAPVKVQFQKCRMGAVDYSQVLGPFEELWLVGRRLVTADMQVIAARHPIAGCWEHCDGWLNWSRVLLLACDASQETASE